MKKLLSLLAVFAFAGGVFGVAHAEYPAMDSGGFSTYNVYRATQPKYGTATKISNAAFLHQVIVSSPATVDFSSDAVLNIYASQDGSGSPRFRIQTSTIEITDGSQKTWTFDAFLSSGMSVDFTSGTVANDVGGSVSLIYAPFGIKNNYRVWDSSGFITLDLSTRSLANGPVLLGSVFVTKVATGTCDLRFYNANTTGSVAASNLAGKIDLTKAAREYKYNVLLTSGLCMNVMQNGTGNIVVKYKKNPSLDWEYWMPQFASGTITNRSIFAGPGIFGGVINGDDIAASTMSVYDSNGTATQQIAVIDGETVFDNDVFDTRVSSGLTFTTSGAAQWTIRYRRK